MSRSWVSGGFGPVGPASLPRCRDFARRGAGTVVAILCLLTCAVAELAFSSPCWDTGTAYSFDECCRYHEASQGNPACWDGEFTYERCCLLELRARVEDGLEILHSGQHRQASDVLFNLHQNFAHSSLEDESMSLHGWEKAAVQFRKGLDAEPHTLSYFEVLFHGFGIQCEPSTDSGVQDVYTEWAHCCDEFGVFTHSACNVIFEMMAHALGRGRHQGDVAKADAYYGNMSEMWAFHHFTPSVLKTHDLQKEFLEEAYQLHAPLAQIFESAEEPTLGIVWADHIPYRSPKFLSGIYFMTLLFSVLQRAGVSGPVHLFEIGAGFGSLPRLFSHAKRHLRELLHPFDVQNFAVLDVRFVIDLQRWYLNKTVGDAIHQRDWIAEDAEELSRTCGQGSCWWDARYADKPLTVDFVDTEMRDQFCHYYAESHSLGADGDVGRATRLLVAVNSWHEFPMADFLWYHSTFVAAPVWRLGVDWILYVSNREWDGNAAKEALLLEPRAHYGFVVEHEDCSEMTCVRVLRRTH